MPLLDITNKGTTDYSVTIRIADSTDGDPETGVVFNTTGIDLWYRRPGAVHTSITEVTQTEAGAHTDGGFVHISDGEYRLDLPDAAVATGADYVDIGGTVTGMVVFAGRVRLTDIIETGSDDRILVSANAHTSGQTVANITSKTGYSLSTAGILAIWNQLTSALTTASTIGKLFVDNINAAITTAATATGFATEAKQDIIDTNVDNLNLGIIYGAAATGTLSTTQATTDLTGYADDQLIDAAIIFTSGNAEGERKTITDYASTNGLVTFDAMTTAPGNGDTFKIV